MDDEIRSGFTKASDTSLSNWLSRELPKHIKLAETSPQTAVNEATNPFTEALLKAANSRSNVVKIKRRCANPSKYPREPIYWNDQIHRHSILPPAPQPGDLSRSSSTHSPDDITSIAVLRDNHTKKHKTKTV
jgi:hypothetical protein